MDDNQLGRNIQHLRKIHGETLDELGKAIISAKSTVKGYENGSRKPDLEKMQLLASHYNKSVDELLYTDLTGLDSVEMDLNSSEHMIELFNIIIPLFTSEEAMENKAFKKGYELSQSLLNSFAKAEILSGNTIVRIFEAYAEAVDTSESPEALANLMWTIFVWWSQLYDTKELLSMQNRLLSKKLGIKDYMHLKDTTSKEIKEKRLGFITDVNDMINEILRTLKSEPEWADLADYYLALRYVMGLVDTELSNEMNTAVGMQMMLSFMTLGNSYAFRFCKTCMDED
jgi:transcriptional regulator with XRE-family HTH domain